jgi:L-ascorbate metabolism protein UlaG (beta-lactamase superfamily)
MDITWYGQACFRMRDRGVSVVADPYDKSIGLKLPRLTADIVTISHEHSDHNSADAVKGDSFVIRGPGEYEVKGLFVTGISLAHDAKGGAERGRNTIYIYDFADATVCHLGDLGHVPTQSQVEEFGHVDVLLIPVGGRVTVDAKTAAEVINLIEPAIVVPMHYALPGLAAELDSVENFLKQLGVKEAERRDSLTVTGKQVPEETQVVVLEAKQG